MTNNSVFSKCDQIRKKLQMWSHLPKKSLMENSFFVRWVFFISVAYFDLIQ